MMYAWDSLYELKRQRTADNRAIREGMRGALAEVVALLLARDERPPVSVPPAPNKEAELIQQAEAVALKHAARAPSCGSPVDVFSGSIEVAGTGYEGATQLDRVVTKAERRGASEEYQVSLWHASARGPDSRRPKPPDSERQRRVQHFPSPCCFIRGRSPSG